jgi:hypothetical protein
MPGCRIVCSALLTLSLCVAPACFGEDIPPGVYRGAYHVDRWGQRQFGFLFVAPELHEQLQPLAGVPVSLHATKVYQPINPGGAMITTLRDIQKLPAPVEIKIAFQPAAAGPAESYRQIEEDGRFSLRVMVTNRSGGPLVLGQRPIYIRLAFHRPLHPSQHNSLAPFDRPGERSLSISEFRGNIRPGDQALDARTLAAYGDKTFPGEPPLEDGQTRSWTLTIERLPAREYEVSVEYSHYQPNERNFVSVPSNVLRLDVLAAQPQPLDGLRVELMPGPAPARPGAATTAWRVRFTNDGERTVRFGLPMRGGEYDFAEHLLCYDREGERLSPPPLVGPISWETLRLEPGASREVPVEVPRAAALARMIYYHSIAIQDATADEKPLANGCTISRHERVSDAASAADRDRP